MTDQGQSHGTLMSICRMICGCWVCSIKLCLLGLFHSKCWITNNAQFCIDHIEINSMVHIWFTRW